jgi:DNA-binding NarL/FixJ family response regulator/class 3 adenylate cyclase
MTASPPPRLFVVEDHDIVRFGIEKLLGDRFQLVGSADEVASAVEMIRERRPDLVLLDVQIPGGGGAAVIDAVRRTDPGVKFLAFTVSTSRDDVMALFRAGVDGYVVKSTDRRELTDLIGEALGGGRPVSPEVAGYMLDIDDEVATRSGIARLTPREREVVMMLARGYSYREMGRSLGISVKTVETHVGHIFLKVGVQSRHELTDRAWREGFVQPGTGGKRLPSGTVSFLRTDIVGSTRLWDNHPTAMPRVLARHDELLRGWVAHESGWVVKGTGDGILAVFERAGQALAAALGALEALQGESFPEVEGLAVRMAINTGEADERDGDYFGPVLNQTSAMLDVCSGGRVLASAVTRIVASTALPAGFIWRELERLQTGGSPSDLPLYEIVPVGSTVDG